MRGGAVSRTAIPITDAARTMDDGRTPLEHALGDGEDFELAFAVAPEDGRGLLDTQPVPGIEISHIGAFVDEGLWLQEGDHRRRLEPLGYRHALE